MCYFSYPLSDICYHICSRGGGLFIWLYSYGLNLRQKKCRGIWLGVCSQSLCGTYGFGVYGNGVGSNSGQKKCRGVWLGVCSQSLRGTEHFCMGSMGKWYFGTRKWYRDLARSMQSDLVGKPVAIWLRIPLHYSGAVKSLSGF